MIGTVSATQIETTEIAYSTARTTLQVDTRALEQLAEKRYDLFPLDFRPEYCI